jgi:hypothetical protein
MRRICHDYYDHVTTFESSLRGPISGGNLSSDGQSPADGNERNRQAVCLGASDPQSHCRAQTFSEAAKAFRGRSLFATFRPARISFGRQVLSRPNFALPPANLRRPAQCIYQPKTSVTYLLCRLSHSLLNKPKRKRTLHYVYRNKPHCSETLPAV